MTAKDIMTSNPACCTADATVQQVAQMMKANDCGIIPVVADLDSKRITGVVTDRDICIRVVAQGMDGVKTLVANVMSTDIRTVTADESLKDCEQLMAFHQVRRIPVVDNGSCVIGMVSQADIALTRPNPEVANVVSGISKPYVA